MTHCHRELIHAQWKILFDDEFIEAWKHGIPLTCCDDVRRRFYIRAFTHSGDYLEKYVSIPSREFESSFTLFRVLLSSIRNLGTCPCPRCLIPLSRVHNLGMPRDTAQRSSMARVDDNVRQSKVKSARKLIYEKSYIVNSAAVENLLKPESLVPTSVRISALYGTSRLLIDCRMRSLND